MVARIESLTKSIQGIDINFSIRTIPLVLLGTLFVSFGLLINQLGFYQDDWHHVYFAHSLGLSRMWDMFLYDGRPLAAMLYIAGFSFLGFTPLHWHISTLILRYLTVLFTWLYLKDIWPDHKRPVAWAALLFAVYPLFKLQPLSVAYTVHWVGYLLFSISIWAMVQSLRNPRAHWAFVALALVTSGLHLAFIEYYSGVELIRPLIIWLLVSGDTPANRQRLLKTLRLWSPYILVFLAFMVYRIYLIPSPEPGYERNIPTVLFDLFRTPFSTGTKLLQNILQDTLFILVTVWGNVFTPDLFNLTQPANIKILIIAILFSIGLIYYLRHLKEAKENSSEANPSWHRSALAIGLAITVLGPIPAWLTNQSVSQDNPLWSGRLGMASMVGASLVVVALLEKLVRDRYFRTLTLVGLVVFSTSWHILYTNDYRWSWSKQSHFYQQLYWRAPFIKEHTTILSDEEIFPYMGEYPTSFALGNLYPKRDQSLQLNYWFYSILRRFGYQIEDLMAGRPFEYSINFGRFQGNSLDSLVIYYRPEENQCLWVLQPEDATLRVLPPVLQQAAALSNLERIERASAPGHRMSADIFVPLSETDWCYFFQKASLARQFEDWDQVVELWTTAEKESLRPSNGVELLPFMESFAHRGDWEQAQILTIRANQLTNGMKHTLCPLWEQIASQTTPSNERDRVIADLNDRIGCLR